jgi:5'-nucleotidase/UDP-sugar diphosphatase
MLKKWAAPAALFFALVFFFGCASGAKPVAREEGKSYSFVLLHTNDNHGSILAKDGLGGLAERMTFIKSIRDQYPEVLMLDAGDINTGPAL